jgi:hypothetical protein
LDGVLEGALVGTLVGSEDGMLDGVLNGALVGTLVGSEDGMLDGVLDGVVIGVLVGGEDEAIEGVLEGALVGSEDGLLDGVSDGAVVGALVGGEDGGLDGKLVGSEDGRLDGWSVGSTVGGNVGCTVGKPGIASKRLSFVCDESAVINDQLVRITSGSSCDGTFGGGAWAWVVVIATPVAPEKICPHKDSPIPTLTTMTYGASALPGMQLQTSITSCFPEPSKLLSLYAGTIRSIPPRNADPADCLSVMVTLFSISSVPILNFSARLY